MLKQMDNMEQLIYTVHAYRWGDRECHSYSVGVCTEKDQALVLAEHEEDYRGGKYKCEVLEWTLGYEGKQPLKVIKALPEALLNFSGANSRKKKED